MYSFTEAAYSFQSKSGAIYLYIATPFATSYIVGRENMQKNEQQNNVPNPKKQCSCRLSAGSRKNRDFEGAGLLPAYSGLSDGAMSCWDLNSCCS